MNVISTCDSNINQVTKHSLIHTNPLWKYMRGKLHWQMNWNEYSKKLVIITKKNFWNKNATFTVPEFPCTVYTVHSENKRIMKKQQHQPKAVFEWARYLLCITLPKVVKLQWSTRNVNVFALAVWCGIVLHRRFWWEHYEKIQ